MVEISGGKDLGAALKAIGAKLSKSSSVSIGFPSDATYQDGTLVALVAFLNEYGSGKTPPRPFFRSMIAARSGEWPGMLMAFLKDNDNDAEKALIALGDVIRGELQASIVDFNSPALSPVTVMLRGMKSQPRFRDMPFGQRIKIALDRVAAGKTSYGASTKPLIDTGEMLRSVVSIVGNEHSDD